MHRFVRRQRKAETQAALRLQMCFILRLRRTRRARASDNQAGAEALEAKADEARAVAEAQVAIAIARAVSEVEPLAQAQVLIKQAEQELIVARVSPQAPAIPLSLDAHRHAFDIPSFPPQRARAAYPSAAYPSVGATPPTSTPPTSTPPSCGAAPRALIHFTRKTCHRFLPEIPIQQIDHPPIPLPSRSSRAPMSLFGSSKAILHSVPYKPHIPHLTG